MRAWAEEQDSLWASKTNRIEYEQEQERTLRLISDPGIN
jgi:hypothetical protein